MYNYNNLNEKNLEQRIITKSVLNSLNNNSNIDFNNINYKQYLKLSNLDYVMVHFGNNLSDNEFNVILNNIGISNNTSNNISNQNSNSKQFTLKTSAGAIYSEE